MTRIAMAVFAFALAGCAGRVSYVASGVPFVARPNVAPSEVRLYRPGDPIPPYTELGYLEYDQLSTPPRADMTLIQSALAEEASARGCNAIVLHDGCTRVIQGRHGTARFARIAATCIWADATSTTGS